MMQYLAQERLRQRRGCGDAGQYGEACDFDLPAAFRLYESARVARTARVVLSVRGSWGRLYHAKGVKTSRAQRRSG